MIVCDDDAIVTSLKKAVFTRKVCLGKKNVDITLTNSNI